MPAISRRHWLLSATAAAGQFAPQSALAREDPWREAGAIAARIRPPLFPARDFDITSYGARGDGAKDCGPAIAAAIVACHQAGGGRVVVPAGVYLTGPVHLRSHVNLHLAQGATLRFSTNPADYLPPVLTRWEGMECRNYSPLVYAFGQDHIAISGPGTLDGQADCSHWWPWKGRADCGWAKGQPHQGPARSRLIRMAEEGVPAQERLFGPGHFLRPMFIQPYRCANVLIEGVTIRNSPMWEIHPVLCRNVTIRGVDISSHGPNNDGCDPESCRDVLIEGCRFDTGDDCIAIKSGRNADGRRLHTPSENILIRGCEMRDGHGGVTIGSEISGGVRNVFAENCRMDSPHLDKVLRLKTNAMRGGTLERIYMRNVEAGQVADSVLHIDFYYEEGPQGAYPPTVRQIRMEQIRCRKTRYAAYIRGFESSPVRGVLLRGWQVDEAPRGNFFEHVEGLRMEDVVIQGEPARRQD